MGSGTEQTPFRLLPSTPAYKLRDTMPTAVPASRKHLLSRLGDVFHVNGKKGRTPTSPVPHLLASNIPPSEEERKTVEVALSHARMQADSLREELCEIQRNKTDSMHRQTRLQESLDRTEMFIEKHQAILSILHSLPDEILALIFTHCLPVLKSRTWGYRTWGYNPSFRLSQVSRRWRAIALADSRLWTILGDVHLTVKTAKENSTYPQFLEELLCRSKNMDLWIFIYCPPHEVLPMGNVHPAINILLKHEKRWRVLGIEASVRTVKAICEPRSETMDLSSPRLNTPLNHLSLPRLQRLDLDIKTSNQGNQISGFANAPALTEVRIAGTYPLIKLPLHQLRVFSQATNGGQDINGPVKEVIKVATNLQRLELIGEQQSVTLPKDTTIDNLKVLHLRLDDTRQNEGEGVLDNLILPNLDELKIASYSLHIVQSITSLARRTLLFTPVFPLRKATLRQIHPLDGTLSELLKLTPKLEELVVEFPAATQVLELLNATKEQYPPDWIPNFRRLVVYAYPKNVDENEDKIIQLAQAMLTHAPDPTNKSEKSLRLIFPTRDSAHHGQITLNNWGKQLEDPLQQLKRDKLLILLRSFRNVLEVNIPELKADRFMMRLDERPPPKRKHDNGFSKRLNGILREVDELVFLKTDVPVLYVSKLHLCLHRLSKLCERDIFGDQKHHFRRRAEGIVKKWCSLFLANLRESETRWALLGTRSLVYVAEDDPLRMSDRAVDIVLGMYDCSDHEDSTWSDHV